MTHYNPGLHIVATFQSATAALQDVDECRKFFDQLVSSLLLSKVGEVYYEFDNGGFTAVICLTESHASIHTWPEHGLATFDVFLSNFQKDNSEKARAFYDATLRFFEGTEINKQEISR